MAEAVSWLEPKWDEDVPSEAATMAAWERTRFLPAPLTDERIDRLLAAFAQTHGDGVRFGSFSLPSDPVLDWYASRNRFEECAFVGLFASSDAMRDILPELSVEELPGGIGSFEWVWENSFALDGQLAASLTSGGYHGRWGDGEEAKAIGLAFCDALFGTRYGEIVIYRSHDAWSGWFFDIAWDATWIIIDKRHRRTSILALTDTD